MLVAALLVLMLMGTLSEAVSGQGGSTYSGMAECGARLLTLSSCGPFVQGWVPAPTQQCCDSFKEVYSEQPGCLCLILDGMALRFNASLALQLPSICSPQMNNNPSSFCSASTSHQAPTALPAVASNLVPPPPMVATVTPIPPNLLLGFGMSAAHQQLIGGGYFAFMLTAMALIIN